MARSTSKAPTPSPAADRNELVDVVDINGNVSRVSRAWIERWPEDFRPLSETATPAATTASVEAEAPAPVQAEDNSSVAQPEKEHE